MNDNLEIGFELDRRFHLLRREMEESKKPALVALARMLDEEQAPYAVIGGVALQVHHGEPRTTLHIELAILREADIPTERLSAAGFRETGRFAHSVSWMGPFGTPLRFRALLERHRD